MNVSILSIAVIFNVFLFATGASSLLASPTTQPSAAATTPAWTPPLSGSSREILLLDDDDDDDKPVTPATQNAQQQSGRYFFGLLDSRSSYGKDFFPDLFLGPEFDKENELEADYLHGENRGSQDNEVDAEFEWNPFGQLTIAGEFGWDSEHQLNFHAGDGDDVESDNASGLESVDLAIYHPIFQYVSSDGALDYTAVARFDLAIPTRTPVSGGDLQLAPYIGHLLRLGDHVSIEAWTGSQFTIAPHQTSQFIYGASLGYQISHAQLPLPLIDSVTPMFELDGQRPFSDQGQDALFGVAGFNWGFASIGDLQPRIGIGYQFPIDEGARQQLRWGVITQVFLDF